MTPVTTKGTIGEVDKCLMDYYQNYSITIIDTLTISFVLLELLAQVTPKAFISRLRDAYLAASQFQQSNTFQILLPKLWHCRKCDPGSSSKQLFKVFDLKF